MQCRLSVGLTDLADGVCLVASVLQVLCHELLAPWHSIRHVLNQDIWTDPGVRGVAPCHDRPASRRAQWLHVVRFEFAAFGCQAVERRGLHHAGGRVGGLGAGRVGAVVVTLGGVVGMVADVVPAVVLTAATFSSSSRLVNRGEGSGGWLGEVR